MQLRGSLIFPMSAVIAILDTEETAEADGYDEDFREVALADPDGTGIGATLRKETLVTISAQVETERDESQSMGAAGDVPQTRLDLVVHRQDLEALGLIDLATGTILVKKGDRIVSLSDASGPVQTFDRVPVYCTESRMLQAFIGHRANLALLHFEERPQGRPA